MFGEGLKPENLHPKSCARTSLCFESTTIWAGLSKIILKFICVVVWLLMQDFWCFGCTLLLWLFCLYLRWECRAYLLRPVIHGSGKYEQCLGEGLFQQQPQRQRGSQRCEEAALFSSGRREGAWFILWPQCMILRSLNQAQLWKPMQTLAQTHMSHLAVLLDQMWVLGHPAPLGKLHFIFYVLHICRS